MKYIILAALPLTLLASCSGSGDKNTNSADSVADSTQQAEAAAKEPAWLPDTAYASAADVKYTIEVNEAIDGHLNSLADLYAGSENTYCFRQDPQRHANFGGKIKGVPSDIVVDWEYKTSSSPKWGGGSGWTGQPLHVVWPDSCMKAQGISTKEEIIVGSLDGYVQFIDYNTGQKSREPIGTGNPIKGTVSLDPSLNGNLYVGEGIPDKKPFGAYVIDLNKNEITDMWAEDPKAPRHWGAFDSNPVRVDRFLFRPGENGCFYKFAIEKGKLTLQSALRYTVNGVGPGMEASMAVYANYGFTGDNHGNILGINLETMRPVWLVKLGDDDDASLVLDVEDGVPYLYASTEIDKQGSQGQATFAKIRATDGEVIWSKKFDGARHQVGEKWFDGGFYATPLLGIDNCKDLIITSRVLNTSGSNGALIALNRKTGETVWQSPLKYYGWSSPVALSGDNGHMYVVVGDCSGNMYVFDGIDGKQLVCKHIGNNFESSPVVIGNSLVVGSRGDTIFKMTVK